MKNEVEKITAQSDKNSTFLLLCCFSALVFLGIFLCFHIDRRYPCIYADELGYLGIARYFSGKYSLPVYNNAFYHFGYSFFIAPVYLLLSDPVKIYQTIVCVNVFVISSAIFFLYKILNYIVSAPKHQLVLIAFTTMLYPAFVYNSMIAWTENFLVFFYLMSLWCFLQYQETENNYYLYLFSFCIGSLYCIHPRFFANIPFSILFFVFLTVMGYLTKKQSVISILIIVAMFIICKTVNMHLYEVGWSHFGVKQISIVDSLKKIKFANLLAEFAGQALYLGISSFLVMFSGTIFLLKKINFKSEKNNLTNRGKLFLYYVGGSALSVFVTSVIFMCEGSRVDHFVYGRYNEVCAPIFIALGVAYLSTCRLSLKHILTVFATAVILMLLLINGRGDLGRRYINFANVIGLLPMYKIFGKFHVLYITAASCTLFMVLCIVNKMKKIYTILFFMVFFICSNLLACPFFKNINRLSLQRHRFSKVLAEKKISSICLDVSSFPMDYYYIQYLLKDADIKLSRNWLEVKANNCNYLITDRSIDNFSNAVMLEGGGDTKVKLYDLTNTKLEPLPSYLNINFAGTCIEGIQEEGFYGNAGSARWSNGHIKLIIPINRNEQIKKLKVGIGAIPPTGTKVKILIDGRQAFNKFYAKGGFEIRLPISKIEDNSNLRVEIISDTFIPAEIDQRKEDTRKLGVHIYRVELN